MHVESWLETYTGIVSDVILAALSVPRRTLAWESIRDPAMHDGSVVYLKEMGRGSRGALERAVSMATFLDGDSVVGGRVS